MCAKAFTDWSMSAETSGAQLVQPLLKQGHPDPVAQNHAQVYSQLYASETSMFLDTMLSCWPYLNPARQVPCPWLPGK